METIQKILATIAEYIPEEVMAVLAAILEKLGLGNGEEAV